VDETGDEGAPEDANRARICETSGTWKRNEGIGNVNFYTHIRKYDSYHQSLSRVTLQSTEGAVDAICCKVKETLPFCPQTVFL
jgi:hypothetical protein